MSYILDALRRAEAERERGEVPGLQSQQHAMLDDDEAPPRSRPLVWVIVALVLALAAAIAWNFLGGEPPRSSPPIATAPVAAPAVAAPVVVAPAVAVALPMAPASIAATPAAPAATMTATASTPAKRPAAVAPPATRVAEAKPGSGRRAETAGAAAAAGSRPSSADARIFAQAELPEDVRRELPRLTIGGASYSGDPASRMVIINGQVFHEGDKIANGLVLEKIKLKAAVLGFKGWRYQIDF